MKKILFFALVMLPLIVFGQTPNTKRTTKAYRQFHPVHQQLVLTLLDEALNDEHGLYWVVSGDTIRGQEEAFQRYIEKNGVKEIFGIPFGYPYEKVKVLLKEKMGSCDKLATTKDCIVFTNKSYEGIMFQKISFMFQQFRNSYLFNKVILRADFKTKDEAVRLKKDIDRKLSRRYNIYRELDQGNFYFSIGGISPALFNEEMGGYAFNIEIQKYEKPKKDSSTYAVLLSFGPYIY